MSKPKSVTHPNISHSTLSSPLQCPRRKLVHLAKPLHLLSRSRIRKKKRICYSSLRTLFQIKNTAKLPRNRKKKKKNPSHTRQRFSLSKPHLVSHTVQIDPPGHVPVILFRISLARPTFISPCRNPGSRQRPPHRPRASWNPCRCFDLACALALAVRSWACWAGLGLAVAACRWVGRWLRR